MKEFLLEREQTIPRSIDETFEFFGDAFNLELITPPFLKFRILTPAPIAMAAGTIIEYQLSLYGIPFKWRTLIESWEPGVRFVDTQISGPYALWHHTHTFEKIGSEETLMKDIVRYKLPMGPLGIVARELFVAAQLKEIFDYRAKATARLLGRKKDETSETVNPLRIAAGGRV